MLDLTALEALFRNLSVFGCKAVGGKVLLFYREEEKDREKTPGMAGNVREPEGQGLVDAAGVKFCKTVLRHRA